MSTVKQLLGYGTTYRPKGVAIFICKVVTPGLAIGVGSPT